MGLFDNIGMTLGGLTDQSRQDNAVSQDAFFKLLQQNPELARDPDVLRHAESIFARNPEILSALKGIGPAQDRAANTAFLRSMEQDTAKSEVADQRAVFNEVSQMPDFPGRDAALDALDNPNLSQEDRANIQGTIAEAMQDIGQADAQVAGAAERTAELQDFEIKEGIKARHKGPDTISQILGAQAGQTDKLLDIISLAFKPDATETPKETAASKEASEQAIALEVEEATTSFVTTSLPLILLQEQMREKGFGFETFGSKEMTIPELQAAVQGGELQAEFNQAVMDAGKLFNAGTDEGLARGLQRVMNHPELAPELERRKKELGASLLLTSQERQTDIVSPAKVEAAQGS